MPTREFPVDASDYAIEKTKEQLERMNYAPLLLIGTPEFFSMKISDITQEIAKVTAMGANELIAAGMPEGKSPEEFVKEHLRLLAYHYELLCRLRIDDPEAWDEVNELYEDD